MTGLRFEGGLLVFARLIALSATGHFFTHVPTGVVSWEAYVLTLDAFLSRSRRESLRRNIVASTTALGPKWVKNASLDISVG